MSIDLMRGIKVKKVYMNNDRHHRTAMWLLSFALLACAGATFASSTLSLGGMASTITGSFTNLTKLVTAGSYLAGLGFAVGAIMKFKQHKENPSNMPVGTPIMLTFIAASLLFLPSILGVTGTTMFGSSGQTSGPEGSVFSTN